MREMAMEYRQMADLAEDPGNVRRHDDRSIDAIRASLERFGQQKPIVVNAEGVVIAGNGTYRAAKALGWERIAVVETNLPTATEQTAFAIADNRTTDLSEFDDAALASVLQAVHADEQFSISFDDLGFSTDDLATLLHQPGANFHPGSEDEQGQLDEKSPTKCPECGAEFHP